jgi:CBS domain-containing protein
MLAGNIASGRAPAPRPGPDGIGEFLDVSAPHVLDRYGPEIVAHALVTEAMATRETVCGPDADLAEVAEIMLAYDVREVLVVDNGDVLGVVTDRDLLRTMLRSESPRRQVRTIIAIDDVWLHRPLEPRTVQV